MRALHKFTSWWGLSASEGAHAAVLAAVAEGRSSREVALSREKLCLGRREPFKLAPGWAGSWCCFSCLSSPPLCGRAAEKYRAGRTKRGKGEEKKTPKRVGATLSNPAVALSPA